MNRLIEIAQGSEIDLGSSMDLTFLEEEVVLEGNEVDCHWGWDHLSKIFHVGTSRTHEETQGAQSKTETYESYLIHCESLRLANRVPETPFTPPLGPSLSLPQPNLNVLKESSLWDTLLKRKTSRDFYEESVSLECVSTLMYSTFGAVHGEDREDIENFELSSFGYRRTSPAGGSLQCIDPYLVAFAVEGLPPGVYQYRPDAHDLCKIRDGANRDHFTELLCNQDFARNMAFAVVLVARFDKLWWKYEHSRAYRVAYLDAGHLSQTFLLGSSAYDLNTWLTGFFFDESLNQFLKLRDEKDASLFVVGAGAGSGSAVSAGDIEAARKLRQLESLST